MATYALAILIAVFFITSVVGVVTGSNSLIAVPVMFQLGVDPPVAIATNMFALVFMSARCLAIADPESLIHQSPRSTS